MRQHVGIVFALGDLGVEFDRRRVMAPSEDARKVFDLPAVALGPRGRKLLRREEDDRSAIGHLRAIANLNPARDYLAGFGLGLRIALGGWPAARLRQRIVPRVGIIHRRDSREIFVLEPEALVVLVAEAAEQPRKGIFLAFALALVPSCRTEEVAAGRSVNGLHLLQTDDRGEVVAAGLNLGGGRQNRDRSRGARGLMTAGRNAGEGRIGLEKKCPQLA